MLGVYKKEHGSQWSSRGRGIGSVIKEVSRPLETYKQVTSSYSLLISANLSEVFSQPQDYKRVSFYAVLIG